MSLPGDCSGSWTTSRKGTAARSLPSCTRMCPGYAPLESIGAQPHASKPLLHHRCCAGQAGDCKVPGKRPRRCCACLHVCLSLSVCLTVLSVCLSVHASVALSLSVCMAGCLSVCLSIHVSVRLSACPPFPSCVYHHTCLSSCLCPGCVCLLPLRVVHMSVQGMCCVAGCCAWNGSRE